MDGDVDVDDDELLKLTIINIIIPFIRSLFFFFFNLSMMMIIWM